MQRSGPPPPLALPALTQRTTRSLRGAKDRKIETTERTRDMIRKKSELRYTELEITIKVTLKVFNN